MSENENQNRSDAEISADEPVAAQPELTSERLILRPFYEQDAEVVQELLQCRTIAANTRSIEHPYPDGAARLWISGHAALWNTSASAIFAICPGTQPDRPVGAIGLEINSEDENAELGYWIGQPSWGKGYCTEAAREIVRFGFSHLGLHKIHANYLVRNPASGRILQKIGMKKEGLFKGHMKKWGVFEDVIYYGITADEFD